MSHTSGLLFDLDGTLVDTAPDLAQAGNHALASIGRPPLSLEQIRLASGQGGLVMLKKGLSLTGGEITTSAEDLLPIFLEYYKAHIADYSQVFPGLLSLIEDAKAAGIPTAIVTNKSEDLAIRLLGALGILPLFPVVIGGDTLATRKPDPAPVYEAMKRLDVTEAVLVGDSYADHQAAKAARIPFIGVGFGYGPFDVNVSDLQWFADQPQHLRSVVEDVLGPF